MEYFMMYNVHLEDHLVATLLVVGCIIGCSKEEKEAEQKTTPSCFRLWNEGNNKTEEEMEIIRRNMDTPPDKEILENRLSDDKLVKKGLEAARKYCYPVDEVQSRHVSQIGRYCDVEFYMKEPEGEYMGGNGFHTLLDCTSGNLIYIHILQ